MSHDNVKGDFTSVIKLKISIRGDHLGLPGWAQCNHKHPFKRARQGIRRVIGDVAMEARG